jgi:hypothetical protein
VDAECTSTLSLSESGVQLVRFALLSKVFLAPPVMQTYGPAWRADAIEPTEAAEVSEVTNQAYLFNDNQSTEMLATEGLGVLDA